MSTVNNEKRLKTPVYQFVKLAKQYNKLRRKEDGIRKKRWSLEFSNNKIYTLNEAEKRQKEIREYEQREEQLREERFRFYDAKMAELSSEICGLIPLNVEIIVGRYFVRKYPYLSDDNRGGLVIHSFFSKIW